MIPYKEDLLSTLDDQVVRTRSSCLPDQSQPWSRRVPGGSKGRSPEGRGSVTGGRTLTGYCRILGLRLLHRNGTAGIQCRKGSDLLKELESVKRFVPIHHRDTLNQEYGTICIERLLI